MTFVATDYWLHAGGIRTAGIPGINTSTIDATGEKFAMIGRVRTPDGATRSIRTIGFRFGTVVTKSGGSALTVSLQNVDTANGPPFRPDGTQDQTVAIANGNASFAASTWITTGNLSADRSVSHGELLAVVVEFDGAGRLGADLVQFTSLSWATTSGQDHQLGTALLTASWASQAAQPNVIFGFSDGSFGTFLGADIVFSAAGNLGLSWDSSSTPDEYATKYTFPNDCKVDAIRVPIWEQTGGDFDIVIEGGVGGTVTVSIDANSTLVNSSARPIVVAFPPVEFGAGDIGYFTIRPSTTTSISTHYFDVNTAAHMEALPGGTALHLAQRTNGGAWTDVTTRRLNMDLHISAVHDGASGRAVQVNNPSLVS